MLSKHLISYTNNKTRIIKTRGERRHWAANTLNCYQCARSFVVIFLSIRLFSHFLRGESRKKMLIWSSDYWSVSQQQNPSARIIFIIATETSSDAAALLSSGITGDEIKWIIKCSRLFSNSISITLRAAMMCRRSGIVLIDLSDFGETRGKGVDCVERLSFERCASLLSCISNP